MGVLKFIVWTACAVGLGIWLASGRVGRHTPVEHTQRLWNEQARGIDLGGLSHSVQEAYEGAKDALLREEDAPPRERHSREDRRALEALITQRGGDSKK